MSKLQNDPAKVVPIRALMIASVLTVTIIMLSMFLDFRLMWTLLFFWLATGSNLIAFRLIVVGVDRMTKKEETRQKATMMPNLMIRYALYFVVLAGAWFIDGWFSFAVAFIGVQISQIAIRLDTFVG